MMYKTHRQIAKVASLASLSIGVYSGLLSINTKSAGGLVSTVVGLGLVYGASLFGAEYPDLDHLKSGPANKNIINKIISRILVKIFRLKHRSRVTHSLDINTILGIILIGLFRQLVLSIDKMSHDISIYLLNLGFMTIIGWLLGVYSHILADMFTEGGAYISAFLPNIRLVPSNINILGFRPFKGKFTTNSKYEQFVFRISEVLSKVLLFLLIVIVVMKFSQF